MTVASDPTQPTTFRRHAWRHLTADRGFTMVEALVAMALFSLILLAVMNVWGSSWRTEADAMSENELRSVARMTMNAITNGDIGVDLDTSDPAGNPLRGLMRACLAATNTDGTALAYTWQEEPDQDPATMYVTSYYLSDGCLYRVNSLGATDPLVVATAGGSVVAESVSAFEVSIEASPSGTYLVQISITVADVRDNSLTLQTGVSPRNWKEGG